MEQVGILKLLGVAESDRLILRRGHWMLRRPESLLILRWTLKGWLNYWRLGRRVHCRYLTFGATIEGQGLLIQRKATKKY